MKKIAFILEDYGDIRIYHHTFLQRIIELVPPEWDCMKLIGPIIRSIRMRNHVWSHSKISGDGGENHKETFSPPWDELQQCMEEHGFTHCTDDITRILPTQRYFRIWRDPVVGGALERHRLLRQGPHYVDRGAQTRGKAQKT